MAIVSKEILKSYFETGKAPTQEEFENLIDTLFKTNNRIIDEDVSGTFNLNHAEANDWKVTLTDDTVFTESNLPTGTDTLEFTLKITGDFSLTFPSYWNVTGDDYDGSIWNFYAIQIHDGNPGTEEATVFLTNLG